MGNCSASLLPPFPQIPGVVPFTGQKQVWYLCTTQSLESMLRVSTREPVMTMIFCSGYLSTKYPGEGNCKVHSLLISVERKDGSAAGVAWEQEDPGLIPYSTTNILCYLGKPLGLSVPQCPICKILLSYPSGLL